MGRIMVLSVAILAVLAVSSVADGQKVCRGIKNLISWTTRYGYWYLKNRYTNCEIVDGTLVISGVTQTGGSNNDMSFLSSIREVTGSVYIVMNDVSSIPLTNLAVVRGRYGRFLNQYSLMIFHNWAGVSQPNVTGMQRLLMPNLREITRGGVYIKSNALLCFVDTIAWDQITDGNVSIELGARLENRYSLTPNCSSCDSDVCSHCWAPGEEFCQRRGVHRSCHPKCKNSCFGDGEDECCHEECTAGCEGPGSDKCRVCKAVKLGNQCVATCPKSAYTYGVNCVDECPAFTVIHRRECVTNCPDRTEEINRVCQPCGERCKKHCRGIQGNSRFLAGNSIGRFKDCQIVDGNIYITSYTFTGDPMFEGPALTREQVNYLSTIEEITGYLVIQLSFNISESQFPYTDLSFLPNLHTIHGLQLTGYGSSLQIVRTPLHTIGLKSLRTIGNGNVLIYQNPELCYVQTVDWDRILPGSAKLKDLDRRSRSRCAGHVCHETCGDGCWGPGPDMCQV